MSSPRIERFQWALETDRELRRLGWRRGHFLAAYYRGRMQDHLPGHAAPLIRRFEVFHQLSQRHATLYLRTGPHGDDWTVLTGVWSHQDYFHPKIAHCRRILDVGANIGMTAVWFHAWLPESEIACVEPDPRNLELLSINLAANGMHARVLPVAAAQQSGQAQLAIGLETGWSCLKDDGAHRHERSVPVTTRRIADILDDLGWAKVDLIKLDIEGAERALLRGCRDWIGRVGQIVLERHQNFNDDEMTGLFHSLRWRLTRIGRHGEATYFAEPE